MSCSPRNIGRPRRLAAAAILLAICAGVAGQEPTTQPAETPADNLRYWLDQGQPTTNAADDAPTTQPTSQPAPVAPADAVPGSTVTMSDGQSFTGAVFTSARAPVEVFVAETKRWRRVPLVAVVSITAEIVAEAMEPEWRPKEIGSPERIYTGREYPTRRLAWAFELADGAVIRGTVKGRPIWVLTTGPGERARRGPFILAERGRGEAGESLSDLPYITRIDVGTGGECAPSQTAQPADQAEAGNIGP